MPPLTLTDLLDDAALLSYEHQLHLGDVLGERSSYSVDLDEPRFAFTGPSSLVCTGFQLLGTASPAVGSWMWGWANPADYPQSLVAASAAVRDFGLRHDLAVLAQPEVPFRLLPGSPEEPSIAAGLMTEAAKVICDRWTSYNFDAGGGTWAAFLVEHPDFRLPPPEPARITRILTEAVAGLPITDHWRAVRSYAVRRPLGLRAAPDHSRIELTAPGLELTVSFDANGRLAGVHGSLGALG